MQVFSYDWFQKHQQKILRFANTYIGRYILRIHGERSSIGKNKIIKIIPNAIFWNDNKNIVGEFRTHEKFAKRLYYGLKPIWYFLHFLDWVALDKINVLQKWSFGFSTLTQYPDPGTGATTVDGKCFYQDALGTLPDLSWANIRAAAGGEVANTSGSTSSFIFAIAGAVADTWNDISRNFFLFDTSSLTTRAVISAAVFSFRGRSKEVSLTAADWDYDVYTSNPASNNILVAADFNTIGTISQTGTPISYASFSTTAYNNWSFNATGISNISKIGISKFGCRSANCDANGNQPTWGNTGLHRVATFGDYADTAGTTTDPKLVVTFTYEISFDEVVMVNDTISKSIARQLIESVSINSLLSAVLSLIQRGFILGRDNDTNTLRGKVKSILLGRDNDTNIINGKQIK